MIYNKPEVQPLTADLTKHIIHELLNIYAGCDYGMDKYDPPGLQLGGRGFAVPGLTRWEITAGGKAFLLEHLTREEIDQEVIARAL